MDKNTVRYNPPIDIGLSEEEVNSRIKNKETNTTSEVNSKSYFQIIIGNIFTLLNMLMLGVAAVLLIIYGPQIVTNLFYLIILIVNTTTGIVQECKSKRALKKLKLMNQSKVTVRRHGADLEVPMEEVLLDDLLILKTGEQVPADCIILDDKIIEVNESLLTGESKAVRKTKGDLLYAGSYIISGLCICRADNVGVDTYLHSIENKAKGFKKPKSKLIISLREIIRTLAITAIPLAILVFWNELVYAYNNNPENLPLIPAYWGEKSLLSQAVLYGGTTITYMIPAGMVLLATIAMTVGVMNLSKKNILTQDLYSVEALSRIDTICLDKTGTLTDGTMTVENTIILDQNNYSNEILSMYLSAFETENQTAKALSDKFGKNYSAYITERVEFSSARKYSAAVINKKSYILGAPEYLTTDKDLLEKVKSYSANGLRVVLFGETKKLPEEDDRHPDVRPMALFIIRDHIRPEVNKTMKWFADNDVAIRVISGDNIKTVSYIAKQSGIKNWEKAIDLSTVSKENFKETVLNNYIFGRVSPEQKAMIVDILQNEGHVVGMTGDGINDIVALKKADCSIALDNGAPATKSIANLVLMDSNFANMTEAVFEGRRVVNNVQRSSSLFVMKDFLWAFITILPILLGIRHTFEPTVMSMVNLMITGLGSFFISIEPNKERITGDFTKNVLMRAISSAFYMFLPVLFVTIYGFARAGLNAEEVAAYITKMLPVVSLCITAAGFVIFFNMCRPFSKFRAILYASVLALSVFILLAAPEFFLINGTTYANILKEMITSSGLGNTIIYFITHLFSLEIYKEITLDQWIIIGSFSGGSFILYYIINKLVTRFLNKRIFKN